MLTRSLTIAGNPNTQITLYFESRSNAERPFEVGENGTLFTVDDFKQHVSISNHAKILSDLITDVNEMFAAQRKMELCKLWNAKKMTDAVESDPLLKVLLETQARRNQPRGMPGMNGGGMIVPPQ